MENENLNDEQAISSNGVLADSKKLFAGMVLVPKKDKRQCFKKNARYVVTQIDVDGNGDIGDYWEVEK